MNFDKILTIIVAIGIIGYVVILSIPDAIGYFNDAKSLLSSSGSLKTEYLLNTYLDSKPNYYFKYEGATYCIKVKTLVEENYITEENIEDMDDVIEAYYDGYNYSFSYNKDCVEK